MAQYTSLTRHEIEAVSADFAINGINSIEVLSGGSENTNYLIEADNDKYVLTICEQKTEQEARELAHLLERIDGLGFQLKLSDKAKDYIADKGFDRQYGARPLKRAIQKYIEDALAEEIVNANLKENDTIFMDLDEKTDELTIKIKKAKKSVEEKD